jgi:hypothetical protein
MSDTHRIASFLAVRLECAVDVTLTDNVRSMVSWRPDREGEGVVVRLHHMFADASEEVLSAVAAYVRDPVDGKAEIASFVREQRDRIRPKQPRRKTLQPKGEVHALDVMFARLNASYFGSRLEMAITWGRKSPKQRPKTMRLGSYCHETGVITIHPRLDRAAVPAYFVEYVIFHEMLHAVLGVQEGPDGRRRVHTPEFRQLERQFHDYERAVRFERRFQG